MRGRVPIGQAAERDRKYALRGRSVSKQAHDKVQTIDVIWWGKSIEEDSGGSRDRHDASRLVDCVNVAEDKLDGCCRGEIG